MFCGDKHTGLDPTYDGQTACEACSDCKVAEVCQGGWTASAGITCAFFSDATRTAICHEQVYVPISDALSDPNFVGKTACEACPQCREGSIANPICTAPKTGFVGPAGKTCSGYAGDQAKCGDVHVGLDPTFSGKQTKLTGL